MFWFTSYLSHQLLQLYICQHYVFYTISVSFFSYFPFSAFRCCCFLMLVCDINVCLLLCCTVVSAMFKVHWITFIWRFNLPWTGEPVSQTTGGIHTYLQHVFEWAGIRMPSRGKASDWLSIGLFQHQTRGLRCLPRVSCYFVRLCEWVFHIDFRAQRRTWVLYDLLSSAPVLTHGDNCVRISHSRCRHRSSNLCRIQVNIALGTFALRCHSTRSEWTNKLQDPLMLSFRYRFRPHMASDRPEKAFEDRVCYSIYKCLCCSQSNQVALELIVFSEVMNRGGVYLQHHRHFTAFLFR